MTSISSNQYMFQSPRTMMDSRISAAVSSGSISTTDQTALEDALDSIDSSLSVDRTSGTKPSGDIKSRIDDLIDQQVNDGTLTDDQATELRNFFAQGPGSADGTAQANGMDGPPPGPPPSDSQSTSSDDDSSDSLADQMTQQINSLMAFLEKLRDSLSSGTYSDSTSSSASSSSANSGLVVDTNA